MNVIKTKTETGLISTVSNPIQVDIVIVIVNVVVVAAAAVVAVVAVVIVFVILIDLRNLSSWVKID